MKHLALLLFLLCGPPLAQAQTDHCDKFGALLDKAKTLWAQKKFEDAFAKLSAAREACPRKAAEVDEQYTIFIRDIANKYETADVKTREAKREAERAKNATDLAQKNATRSDSIARRAYADDLAYKSTIALRDGDRTSAFRLAEFAHRYVDDANLNVTNALVQAIYYNEDPTHSFLPWATNLEGHKFSILSVAFSPDGKKLATGSFDKSAKIWDLKSGKNISTLQGHSSYVRSVAFSPDGKKLATGSNDNSAKIWNIESGKEIMTLLGHSASVRSVAFSPDGKKLATSSDDFTAKIWDLESKKSILTLEGHSSPVLSVAFSPDGKKLASCSTDYTAKIWDIESGKDIQTLRAHRSTLSSVAFSPDGKKIATGSHDKTAKIWDIETGKDILTLSGHTSTVYSVAFSPDGNQLVTGSEDKSIKIWDLDSGKDILTLRGHSTSVRSVTFSPDGKRLATGSEDNIAKIWNLDPGSDIQKLDAHSAGILSIAFSPDGKKLATGSHDHTAKIWDIYTGKNIQNLQGHGSPVLSVAFSPDGKTLATGSEDKTAKIWNLESGKDIQTLIAHTASVRSIAFSPDGKKLATGSDDETTKIWDVVSGKNIMSLQTRNASGSDVVFSPDGETLATSSEDRTAKIWELASGKDILTLSGHNSYVRCIAFSPDGKKLATGSDDGIAKIWELTSGKDILTLSGQRLTILDIAFSPDGKNLATCSQNGMTKIWDLNSGKDILTFNSSHISVVNSIAFSPDGKKLATGSYDQTAKILELTPEGWMSGAGRNRQLAGLTFRQLDAYNLSGLLDTRPENEQILKQSKVSRQITAFAELSAQNTRNSRDLRRTATDFGRAARLYGYAFDNSGDSALLVKLGDLYLLWAEDILASNRPDTATRYIDLACSLYEDKYQCPRLWHLYAQKTGKPFKFDRFLDAERADDLQGYGDYFFEKEQWAEARQLYEKAQRKQFSTAALQKLYLISEKTGKSFDFQRFLALDNTRDLYDCANFFIRKAQQLEKFKDRIPDYQNALHLREKLIKLDTAAHLRFETANEYNNLGFYQLFLPDGKAAEASIRHALELDPANKFTHTNIAPALLLQGKTKEAEEAYKKWAPLPFNEPDLATYRDAFLDDLKKMEEQGVQGFDFTRVRAWLAEK